MLKARKASCTSSRPQHRAAGSSNVTSSVHAAASSPPPADIRSSQRRHAGGRAGRTHAQAAQQEAYTSVHFGDDLFVLRRTRTGHAHGAGDGIGGGRTGRVSRRRRRAHRRVQDAAATRHNQREHRATPTWFGLQRERRSRGSLQDCTRTPTWLPTTPRATSRPRQDPSSRSPGQTIPALDVQFASTIFVFLPLKGFGPGRVCNLLGHLH